MLYSIDIEQFEIRFWDEIWGCVNYIKIPYDTVMAMPIQDRKIWIKKHNMDVEKENGTEEAKNKSGNISGEMLNGFARREQTK